MLQRLVYAILLFAGSCVGAAAQTPAPAAVSPPPGAQATPQTAAPDLCAAPPDIAGPETHFPHVAEAVRAGKSLDVLAIGSATMAGPRSGTDGSFPYRMAALLRIAFPGVPLHLTLHVARGVTAADMLGSLRTELATHSYQLVLWQTGTVEANGDLVLIDPQYSRFLRANANLDPYLEVMQQAAGLPDVALFHRYDLMKYWVDAGQIDLERAARGQRQVVADALHNCLGQALAQILVRGTIGDAKQ
jgi:hypothetical protein